MNRNNMPYLVMPVCMDRLFGHFYYAHSLINSTAAVVVVLGDIPILLHGDQ